jgi:hypothetical protein
MKSHTSYPDDVAEDDVGPHLLHLLDRESSIADRDDLEIFVREGQLDHLLDGDAVVRKQDLLAHRPF